MRPSFVVLLLTRMWQILVRLGALPTLLRWCLQAGWLAGMKGSSKRDPPPPDRTGRQNFKPGSAGGIQSDPGSQG